MSKLKSMEDQKCSSVLTGFRIIAIINMVIFLMWCFSWSTFTSRSCLSTTVTENGRDFFYYRSYNEKFNELLNSVRDAKYDENEMTFNNILIISLSLSLMGIFLMECWLCRTLIIASDETQASYWYKWLLWRLILLVFYAACLSSIYVLTECWHLTSIIYLLYGFGSTVVIHEYRKHKLGLN